MIRTTVWRLLYVRSRQNESETEERSDQWWPGHRLTLRRTFVLLIVFGLVASALWAGFSITSRKGTRPPVFRNPLVDNGGRKEAIESAFRFAWDGYYRVAFPHDELHPVSNTPGFSRNDWGATPVDALGTAILMEMPDVVETILEHVMSINFNHTTTPISVFETTIRYLGGMLSAYDLLKGPFASVVPRSLSVENLLLQSENLARVLSAAFDDGRALPSSILEPDTHRGNNLNSVAGAGTLVLEWTRLSDLSHNRYFANISQSAESLLLNPQPSSSEPFPGLVGTNVDAVTGKFLDSDVSWGGSSDSFYEYLIKMYVYDKSSFGRYMNRWVLAADSAMTHLASSPKGHPDISFLGRFDGDEKRFIPESGHMECFAGGNFLLGGMVLNESKYSDFGLKLVDGCRHIYTSTMTRIGPEKFMWTPSSCETSPLPWNCNERPTSQKNILLNNANGFWITESSYNLRPEVIESYYYAYRMTKDEKYREWAWDAFEAIARLAQVGNGFNYLRDVDSVDGKKRAGDNQESYLFSETFKYLYLIFSDDGEWQVNFKGENMWIYNTEGHPLRVLR